VLAPTLGVSATDEEAIMIGSPIDALRKLPMDGMGFVLFILGATTLGIGGIGILSMMLDAVQERRQEIGVRLAVGARRRDILLQFFLETFVIAIVGGVVGVALGIGCCRLMEGVAVPGRIPAPILTPEIVAVAVISMVMVGIISGTVPAWRASRVEPSVTLRAE
jgi:putative ABC transport system permease protein